MADFQKGEEAYEAGDYAAALREFIPLAEQGDAESQRCLGRIYVLGEGVAQDYAKAAKWSRKAAEQGDAEAQFNLGLMYANGQGVAEDYAQAAAWFRKAAEQGHAEAQVKLDIYADYLKSKEKAENEAKAEARAEEAEARAEASLNKTFIVTYRSTKKGGLIKGHSKMKALFASFDNTEEIEAKTKKEAKEKFKNMNKGILSPQTIVSIEEK